MTRILAIDTSKRCTGWAFWKPGRDMPAHGSFRLGSEFTSHGRVFAKLHEELAGLWTVTPADLIVCEKPLEPGQMAKINNFDTPYLLYGIAAHAQSFAVATGARFMFAHVQTWGSSFLKGMRRPRNMKKAQKKQLTVERCREYGLFPANDDEADALGILTYACEIEGLPAPWTDRLTLFGRPAKATA